MSITTYPINTPNFSPVLVNGLPSSLTLYNSSTSLSIVINDSSAGNGYPMAPGSTISWDAGKALYASCTGTANLVVLDNAGNIDNPQILAQLIVDSGLGQSVADALKVTGVPVFNVTDELYRDTVVVPSGGFDSSLSFDVSAYNSVNINVNVSVGSVPYRDYSVNASWTSLNGTIVGEDLYRAVDGVFQINIPTRAAQLTLYLGNLNNPASIGFQVTVNGSHSVLPKRDVLLVTGSFPQSAPSLGYVNAPESNFIAWGHTIAANATMDQVPSLRPGRAQITVRVSQNITAGVMQFYVFDRELSSVLLYRKQVPVGSGLFTSSDVVYLPNRQCTFRMTGDAALAPNVSAYMAVTYLD